MSLHGILVSRAGFPDDEDTNGTTGVLLGVGQPYEAALAEARAHFKIPHGSKARCSFVQRVPARGRLFVVAPSAWHAIQAGDELEFLVTYPAESEAASPLKKPKSTLPSSVPRFARDDSPAGGPPTWVPSQNGAPCITPATPSGTDTDGQVSDSEAEECSIRERAQHAAMFRAASQGSSAASTSGLSRRPSTPPAAERDREQTPSPSNRSQEYKVTLQRHLAASRICEQEPDPTSFLPSTGSLTARRHAVPAVDALDRPARSSGETTDSSFLVGLGSDGQIGFVRPSPPPCGGGASLNSPSIQDLKGKGRALDYDEESDEEATRLIASQVKAELLSSQPVRLPHSPTQRLAPPPSSFRPILASTGGDPGTSGTSADDLAARLPTPGPSSRESSAEAPRINSVTPRKRRAERENESASSKRHTGDSRPARTSPTRGARTKQVIANLKHSARNSPRKSLSARKKDKRDEALASPRAPIPAISRSERFHYWIRLPNWPPAPRNQGPLQAQYVHKQGARDEMTLGLLLRHVFTKASELTGWQEVDLKATIYPKTEDDSHAETVLWGWDTILTHFASLEEVGMPENGGVIDLDYRPFKASRSYLDLD